LAGLDTTDHRVPFHRSASVLLFSPFGVTVNPTAAQAVAEAQDTPRSSARGTLGAAAMDHRVPFHVSISGCMTDPLALPVSAPAATQKCAEVHDTAARESPLWGTLGLGTTAQVSA
jgi:hypothetical protein